MFRRSRGSTPTPKKDAAAEAKELLSKIELSLAEAKRDKSFPKVNEGRRLAKELESHVGKMSKKDEAELWRSQIAVVNDEIESVMATLMGSGPADNAASSTPGPAGGGGLFDGLHVSRSRPPLTRPRPVPVPAPTHMPTRAPPGSPSPRPPIHNSVPLIVSRMREEALRPRASFF